MATATSPIQALTIPLSQAGQLPWLKMQITLTGVTYTLAFRYNTRSNRWIMDVLDPSGNQLLVGLPVLINRDVTGQYLYLSVPPGLFLATDDTQQGNQPTIYSFGLDHTLWYLDPGTG